MPGDPGSKGEKGDTTLDSEGTNGRECTRTVAFAARASKVHAGSDLRFTDISSNIGGGFDGTGQFTAPVGGAYFFHVTARANGNTATSFQLYKGSDVILNTGRSDASSTALYPVGSNMVVVGLQAGDAVQLQVEPQKEGGGFFSSLFSSSTSETDVTFDGFKIPGCGN